MNKIVLVLMILQTFCCAPPNSEEYCEEIDWREENCIETDEKFTVSQAIRILELAKQRYTACDDIYWSVIKNCLNEVL